MTSGEIRERSMVEMAQRRGIQMGYAGQDGNTIDGSSVDGE